MKLNLNDNIKVKLTDYGKEIFYHRYDWLVDNKTGKSIIMPQFPKVDSDGYTKFQLHEFMHTYGNFMIVGGKNVIEPLDIELDD